MIADGIAGDQVAVGAKEVDPLEGIAGDGIVEDHVGGIDAVGPREVNPLVAIVEHLVLRDADRRRALGDLDAVAEVVLRDVLLEDAAPHASHADAHLEALGDAVPHHRARAVADVDAVLPRAVASRDAMARAIEHGAAANDESMPGRTEEIGRQDGRARDRGAALDRRRRGVRRRQRCGEEQGDSGKHRESHSHASLREQRLCQAQACNAGRDKWRWSPRWAGRPPSARSRVPRPTDEIRPRRCRFVAALATKLWRSIIAPVPR